MTKTEHASDLGKRGANIRPPTRPTFDGQALFHLSILALGLVAFILTFSFDPVPPPLRRGLAPETFPRLVIGLIVLLTLISFWREAHKPSPSYTTLSPVFWISMVGLVLFLVVGFYVDILLAMMLFSGAMTWVWGNRRPIFAAIIAFATPLVLFILFSELLGIRFPRGLIVDLIYG